MMFDREKRLYSIKRKNGVQYREDGVQKRERMVFNRQREDGIHCIERIVFNICRG